MDHVGPTMNDFIAFLDGVLGLDSTVISGQDLGGGITLNASGQIVITGNEGTVLAAVSLRRIVGRPAFPKERFEPSMAVHV